MDSTAMVPDTQRHDQHAPPKHQGRLSILRVAPALHGRSNARAAWRQQDGSAALAAVCGVQGIRLGPGAEPGWPKRQQPPRRVKDSLRCPCKGEEKALARGERRRFGTKPAACAGAAAARLPRSEGGPRRFGGRSGQPWRGSAQQGPYRRGKLTSLPFPPGASAEMDSLRAAVAAWGGRELVSPEPPAPLQLPEIDPQLPQPSAPRVVGPGPGQAAGHRKRPAPPQALPPAEPPWDVSRGWEPAGSPACDLGGRGFDLDLLRSCCTPLGAADGRERRP